jgi:hypothetical protein
MGNAIELKQKVQFFGEYRLKEQRIEFRWDSHMAGRRNLGREE